MWQIFLVVAICISAFQAVESKKMSHSALWLAVNSALTSWLLFLLGAPEIAVIELSVGAGVVTILLVFAINIVGDQQDQSKTVIPRFLALFLIISSMFLLGGMLLPVEQNLELTLTSNRPFAENVWELRFLDTLLQIVILFAGVLGVLSLMEERFPLSGEKQK